jgi:hypothetical protein
MPRYAAETTVTIEKSQAEIRTILKRYGATGFAYAEDDQANAAMIVFRINDRHYRVYVPLPDKHDPQFRTTATGRYRASPDAVQTAYDQAVKQRWRAVALYIKALLEAAASGIISVEQALLAHLLLPNGQTLGQATAEPVAAMYRSGQMQPLLPGLTLPAFPEGSAHG